MILKYLLFFFIILISAIFSSFCFSWIFFIFNKNNLTNMTLNSNMEKAFLKNNNKNVIEYKAYIENSTLNKNEIKRMKFTGEKDCALFKMIYDSETNIPGNCIGYGSCVKVCEQEAIYIEDEKAVITTSCNGCGKCVDICPNGLIKLTPNVDFSSKTSNIVKKDFKFWKLCFNMFSRG